MMTPPPATEGRYGLGLSIATFGSRTLVGHDGGNPGVGTVFYVDPQTGDGIVLMTNRSWGYQVNYPIFCAWRNWTRGEREAEECRRDVVGLIVQTIVADGMDAGRAHLERVRAERPPAFVDQAVARLMRQLTYAERADDALTVARWGVDMAPDSAASHVRLGDALAERGDTAGARVSYEAALRINPDDADTRAKLERMP
jgi:tetratricopeptide (TPR) repeat protein